jgi:hypothetical protein
MRTGKQQYLQRARAFAGLLTDAVRTKLFKPFKLFWVVQSSRKKDSALR